MLDNAQQQDEEEGDQLSYPQAENYNPVHIYRLDNHEIIEQIEHQLNGEVKIRGEWKRKREPWANEEGIAMIMGILTSVGLNKNINLGYLTDIEIYMRCNILWKRLAYMICVNYYKYGIIKSHRSMLIQIIIQQTHSALSRSLFGKEAKQLSSTTSHVEHTLKEDKVRQPIPLNPARWLGKREGIR